MADTSTFGYDWAKRSISVASPSIFTGTATTTYRLDGLLAKRTNPNGETISLAYDSVRRPTTATLANGSTISQTYDRVGNVTSEGRSLSGVTGDNGVNTNTFTYDPLRRLTAESGLASPRSYQYDLDGNRTRKVEGATTIDYTYDRTDQLINQTISGVGTAYAYDAYGNMTQSGNSVSAVTTYTFDTASHMTSINAPGSVADVALTLDALGRYATRAVNGGTPDTYGYLGSTETVTSIVGSTTRVSAIAADGSRIATKDASTTAYLLPDLHGNVIGAEGSASTAIVNAIRYDGYGQTMGAPFTGSGSIVMDTKYQGRLDLSASSDPLYDMSARFYSPGAGTFTQLDSVMGTAQDPMSMNRFMYAEANPTTFTDPTGHATVSDGGGGCTPNKSNTAWCKAPPKSSIPISTPRTSNAARDTNDSKRDSKSTGGATSPVGAYTWGGPDERVPERAGWEVQARIGKGCSINLLGCSVSDFDAMSSRERIGWVRALQAQYGSDYNFSGWFNVIDDLITFAGEEGLVRPGNWFSNVDAYILSGIQNGLRATVSNDEVSEHQTGAAQWQQFFSARRQGQGDGVSRELWGVAEQRATDYGNQAALNSGLRPENVAEVVVGLGTGNVYRAVMSNTRGVLGAIGSISGALPGGALAVPAAGAYFDPTSKGPIYVSAKALYAGARYLTYPTIEFGYQVLLQQAR